jgi:hypothetical protein
MWVLIRPPLGRVTRTCQAYCPREPQTLARPCVSRDVLRFLGKRLYPNSSEDVTSSYQDRPEGIRVKHQAHANSVKTYDKGGSILRTECTINNHRAFSVYRQSERNPEGPKKRLPMSKGIADLYARSQVSG